MLSDLNFESIFEHGVSTIDDSARAIQRTFDEVVWGIDSPPSVVEKKGKPADQAQKNANKDNHRRRQLKARTYSQNNGDDDIVKKNAKLLSPRSSTRQQVKQFNQRYGPTTPSTVVEDWDDDSSGVLASDTSTDKSFSSTNRSNSKQRTPTRIRSRSSIGKTTMAPAPSILKSSQNYIKQQQQQQKQLQQQYQYSSHQHHLQQSKSLPPSISAPKRRNLSQKLESPSALQAKSVNEIFGYNTVQTLTCTKTHADQDVGLDLYVLDIPSSVGGLKTKSLLIVQRIDPRGIFSLTALGVGDAILSINGVSFREPVVFYGKAKVNSSRVKPNLYQARALLNGRGLSVTLEYQKFGETNTSICSETLQKQQIQRNLQKENRKQPKQNLQTTSSTRVDFLGRLQCSHTTKPVVSAAPSSNKTKISVTTHQPKQRHVEDPPKISRLMKLKARTQQLRYHGQKKLDSSKRKLFDKENKLSKNGPSKEISKDSSPLLPYGALLSNQGPEDQIELLKERVQSSSSSRSRDSPVETIDRGQMVTPTRDVEEFNLEQNFRTIASSSPARSVHSTRSTRSNHSQKSTLSARSESYLQELRRGLSPTANAILADLSFGNSLDISERSSQSMSQKMPPISPIPPSSPASNDSDQVLLDGQNKDLIRINRKVVDKLQSRINSLKRSNIKLSNELAAVKKKKDYSTRLLVKAEKELDEFDAKEKAFESKISLLESRLEMSTIQSDKRNRELLDSKEKAIAKNDKVISQLTKRIEGLQKANQQFLEKIQKREAKSEEKQSNLQAQFDRLKMKFTAQSTLLDNVMTGNEELTSQNELLESELAAYSVQVKNSKLENDSNRSNRSNNSLKYSSHDISNNIEMFLGMDGSENDLEHIKKDPILLAQAKELSTCKERNAYLEEQVERLSKKLSKSFSTSAGSSDATTPTAATDTTSSCALDVTYHSSGDDEPDSRHSHLLQAKEEQASQESQSNPGNTSVENPSDESQVNTSSEESFYGSSPAKNKERLNAKLEEDKTPIKRNHNIISTKSVDESVDSANTLVLMERILDLERALQTSDLAPEDSDKFVDSLKSRIATLTEKGYAHIGSIKVTKTPDGSPGRRYCDL